MPNALIVGGPNGAGKTSFLRSHLPLEAPETLFLNADAMAEDMLAVGSRSVEISAARLLLSKIDDFVGRRVDFAVETTLASLSYATKIPTWKTAGYRVSLVYLRLPSVESSIARVRRRVDNGGHGIPEATIRRRFPRSLKNLEDIYKPLVDEWVVYDSLDGSFSLIQESAKR